MKTTEVFYGSFLRRFLVIAEHRGAGMGAITPQPIVPNDECYICDDIRVKPRYE